MRQMLRDLQSPCLHAIDKVFFNVVMHQPHFHALHFLFVFLCLSECLHGVGDNLCHGTNHETEYNDLRQHNGRHQKQFNPRLRYDIPITDCGHLQRQLSHHYGYDDDADCCNGPVQSQKIVVRVAVMDVFWFDTIVVLGDPSFF